MRYNRIWVVSLINSQMKKILFFTIIILSLGINAFFVVRKAISEKRKDALFALFDIKNIPYEEGLHSLFQKLNQHAPGILKNNEYLFIQTFDTITTKGSRTNYMTALDSILSDKRYSGIDKVLVSEMPIEDLRAFMSNHNLSLRSFKMIPDADDFISSVFILKKAKSKSHPMQLIINKKGEIFYYNARVSGIEAHDSTLYYLDKFITP